MWMTSLSVVNFVSAYARVPHGAALVHSPVLRHRRRDENQPTRIRARAQILQTHAAGSTLNPTRRFGSFALSRRTPACRPSTASPCTCNASPIGHAVGLPGVPARSMSVLHFAMQTWFSQIGLSPTCNRPTSCTRRRCRCRPCHTLSAIARVHLGQTQRRTLIGVRGARIRIVLRARRSSQPNKPTTTNEHMNLPIDCSRPGCAASVYISMV